MANDLRSFQLQLDRAYERKVDQRVHAATRWVALEALRRVVMKSPVAEGRFKGNWQAALSVRPDGVLDVVDPNGAATIAEGSRNISQLRPYEVVFLSNNVPYARRLEEGHSQQAPQGVVAVTVAELKAFFNNIPADRPIP